nr:Rrf2 family transcriptional regulator [Butyrivibrio sp. WCD2001]
MFYDKVLFLPAIRRRFMFSTKGRYALRVMIDLAQQNSSDYIPLKDIAERQDISKKYLEIIAKEMVKGGLIKGASGKHGGYKLLREPDEYSIGEIIELMEGTFSPVVCLEDNAEECPRKEKCKTLSMWSDFYKMEKNFFYEKKLSDLL